MIRSLAALSLGLSLTVATVAAPVPAPAPADNRAALKVLREATEVLDKVTGDVQSRVQLWCSVATLSHSMDDKGAATLAVQKAIAVAATSRDTPVEEWRYIGRSLGKFGDADAVLKLVEGVPAAVENRRGNPRHTILQESATAAATAGHLKAAEKLAEAIRDEKTRAWVLASVRPLAAAKAAGKDAKPSFDALATAHEKVVFLVGETYYNLSFDTVLTEGVAAAKLRAKDKPGAKEAALKALALIPDVEAKRQPPAALAVIHTLAKLDDVAAAQKLFAEQLARTAGKPNRAWELIAQAHIAAAEVRLGKDADALKRVPAFTEPGEQAFVLQYVAQAQGTAGRKTDAAANFAQAVEWVEKAANGPGTTLHNIASAQAAAGDFEGAGKTAALLGRNGTIAWANIIHAQVQAGDFDGARKNAIEHVTNGSRFWLANTMQTIAGGQAAAGKADAAREWIGQLNDPLLQAYALVGVAQGLYREAKK